jgi:hypothetical protein
MFAGTALTKNLAQKSRKGKSKGKHKRTRFPQSAVAVRVRECIRKLNPGGRADVIGLDEVVQKLQVRRLKVRISPIGIGGQVSLRTPCISQSPIKKHLEKQIQQTTFHFHNLKRKSREKLCELRPIETIGKQFTVMQGGKVDGNR